MGSDWLLPFPELLQDLRTHAVRWQDLHIDSSQPLDLENLRSLSAARGSAVEEAMSALISSRNGEAARTPLNCVDWRRHGQDRET